MKSFIISVAALLLVSACSNNRLLRQVSATASTAPTSILFIGNSYSFNIPKELRRTAKRHGKKIRVGQITHGGWSLAQHVKSGEAIREIREGDWDIVVLQEQSRIPALPFRRIREMIPNVRKLADEARAAGALPILYQTWGRRDGDSYFSSRDTFHAMNQRLRSGYQQAAKAAGGLAVVPVGDAWEREVDSGKGDSLFMPDGSHPTASGEKLTAEVLFTTLLRTPVSPG